WMKREHRDSGSLCFGSEILAEFDDSGLRDRVCRDLWPPVNPGVTGNVDDAAAPPCDHAGQDCPGTNERATHVDIHGAHPFVGIDFPQWTDWSADPRFVDQDVDRSEPPLDSLDRVLDSLKVCYVGGERHSVSTCRVDERRGFGHLIGGASHDGDRSS